MQRNICTTDVQNLLLHISALSRCHLQGSCTVGKALLVMCHVHIPVHVMLGFIHWFLRYAQYTQYWNGVTLFFIYLSARLRVSGYILETALSLHSEARFALWWFLSQIRGSRQGRRCGSRRLGFPVSEWRRMSWTDHVGSMSGVWIYVSSENVKKRDFSADTRRIIF